MSGWKDVPLVIVEEKEERCLFVHISLRYLILLPVSLGSFVGSITGSERQM